MTTKTLFSFFGAIFFFTVMSLFYYFGKGIHTLPIYLLAAASIFFGYFSYKSIAAPWLDEDPELEEEILDKALMNHFINRVILTDKLVFIQHNFKGKEGKRLEILFADISEITDFKYYKIIDTGLVITLLNGQKERFVIDKTTDLYAKLKTLGH